MATKREPTRNTGDKTKIEPQGGTMSKPDVVEVMPGVTADLNTLAEWIREATERDEVADALIETRRLLAPVHWEAMCAKARIKSEFMPRVGNAAEQGNHRWLADLAWNMFEPPAGADDVHIPRSVRHLLDR